MSSNRSRERGREGGREGEGSKGGTNEQKERTVSQRTIQCFLQLYLLIHHCPNLSLLVEACRMHLLVNSSPRSGNEFTQTYSFSSPNGNRAFLYRFVLRTCCHEMLKRSVSRERKRAAPTLHVKKTNTNSLTLIHFQTVGFSLAPCPSLLAAAGACKTGGSAADACSISPLTQGLVRGLSLLCRISVRVYSLRVRVNLSNINFCFASFI